MSTYDAIVIGARCAGSPTAMLLARQGYDVLLVDRARFPSDTVSTHLLHPPGADALRRWGLFDRLVATGCPPITRYTFDFGPAVITGTPRLDGAPAVAYCPRRTVLDAQLVEAADQAGATVRDGFTVSDLVFDADRVVGVRGRGRNGTRVTEHARVVVGADGAHSRVAEAVAAPSYREGPVLSAGYYAYWSGFAVDGARWALRSDRGFAAAPTNDGLTMLLVAWPFRDVRQVKQDIEAHYLQALRQAYGDRLASARRETRIVGGGVANRFRKPYGPGWALVGDAGYLKDPVTAQGISDAFRDAELCAAALDQTLRGVQPFGQALADYQRLRDAHVLPVYEFTAQIGSLEPPPIEFQQLLGTIAGNQPSMDAFASVFAGTLAPAELFGVTITRPVDGRAVAPGRGR